MQGCGLLLLPEDKAPNWPKTAFIEQNRQVTVARGRYKCSIAQDEPRGLYDLKTDPREWNNLIGKEASDAILADMKKHFTDWRPHTRRGGALGQKYEERAQGEKAAKWPPTGKGAIRRESPHREIVRPARIQEAGYMSK